MNTNLGELTMRQITLKDLEAVCKRINVATNSPIEPWVKIDGKLTAQIGCYYLSGAYGGYNLERICNEGGGVNNVFGSGFMPKRELYERMQAFLTGYSEGKS